MEAILKQIEERLEQISYQKYIHAEEVEGSHTRYYAELHGRWLELNEVLKMLSSFWEADFEGGGQLAKRELMGKIEAYREIVGMMGSLRSDAGELGGGGLVCPNCDGEGFSGKGTNEILPCARCFGSGEMAE